VLDTYPREDTEEIGKGKLRTRETVVMLLNKVFRQENGHGFEVVCQMPPHFVLVIAVDFNTRPTEPLKFFVRLAHLLLAGLCLMARATISLAK